MIIFEKYFTVCSNHTKAQINWELWDLFILIIKMHRIKHQFYCCRGRRPSSPARLFCTALWCCLRVARLGEHAEEVGRRGPQNGNSLLAAISPPSEPKILMSQKSRFCRESRWHLMTSSTFFALLHILEYLCQNWYFFN